MKFTEWYAKVKEKGYDFMMTADQSLFLWNKNDEWWNYDEKGNIVLTPKAPEKAKESFKKFKEHMTKAK